MLMLKPQGCRFYYEKLKHRQMRQIPNYFSSRIPYERFALSSVCPYTPQTLMNISLNYMPFIYTSQHSGRVPYRTCRLHSDLSVYVIFYCEHNDCSLWIQYILKHPYFRQQLTYAHVREIFFHTDDEKWAD